MSYTKTSWVTGDIATANKMNHIEDGIYNNDGNISTLQTAVNGMLPANPSGDGLYKLINTVSSGTATKSWSDSDPNLAEPYDSTKTYAVGEHCTYKGQYKVCIVPITTAEAWTEAHWKDAEVGTEVSDLKSALNAFETQSERVTGVRAIDPNDFDIGNISISNSGWTYSNSTTRVRTKQGVTIPLKQGDVIGLTDYTNAKFYLGWQKSDQSYGYSGWKTSDYVIQNDGNYVILLCNLTEATVTDKSDLLDLLFIKTDSLVSKITNLLDNPFPYGTESKIGDYVFTSRTKDGLISSGAVLIKFDATAITHSAYVSVSIRDNDKSSGWQNAFDIYKGEIRYVYCPKGISRMYFALNEYIDSDTLSVYKVDTAAFLCDQAISRSLKCNGTIASPTPNYGKMWGVNGLQNYNSRVAIGLYHVSGDITVSLSDYTKYKYAVVKYNAKTGTRDSDSGWKTETVTFHIDASQSFGITLTKVGVESAFSSNDYADAALTATSTGYFDKLVTYSVVEALQKDINNALAMSDTVEANESRSELALFAGRFKPCYDHLFVNRSGNNVTIPHESLYHVRLSKKMGFNTIEANVAATSDGVFVVNHLDSGKFGAYFHHVDGETDISNTALSSVTWDWVVQNVRYNSTIKKYQTRPCRLEEFLSECRQQNIIPFITSTNADVITIAEQYMGKDNYIAYGGSRANCPSAIIYHWVTKTTKEDILAYCESVGKPFIYGMSNPTAFTDAQLKEIINAVHEAGYWIGTSYSDVNWYKYSAMGMDFNGTQQLVNRIESGNLYNITSMYGFDNFITSNATETDGVLTFSAEGNIWPDIEDTTYDVCMIDIEIWFNGDISFYAIGEFTSTYSYTSDGTQPVFLSIPIINGSPKWHIVAAADCVVYDIKFKASVF